MGVGKKWQEEEEQTGEKGVKGEDVGGEEGSGGTWRTRE